MITWYRTFSLIDIIILMHYVCINQSMVTHSQPLSVFDPVRCSYTSTTQRYQLQSDDPKYMHVVSHFLININASCSMFLSIIHRYTAGPSVYLTLLDALICWPCIRYLQTPFNFIRMRSPQSSFWYRNHPKTGCMAMKARRTIVRVDIMQAQCACRAPY